MRAVEQGATFGFGDELNAAEQAAEQPVLGTTLGGTSSVSTFSQRYDENLAAERAWMADIPAAVAIPGQLVGGGATIAAEAPLEAARIGAAGARLLPGGEAALNALSNVGSGVGTIITNGLSNLGRYAVPAPKGVAEGAGYGAVQGFGDGKGGLDNRLQSAGVGAAPGAVLAPAVAGGASLVGKGITAAGRAISEAGFGAKNALSDAGGQTIVGTDGQPVTATPIASVFVVEFR